MAGATAEIELKEGIVASGKYFPDGTAKIDAWGETFPRTWEVQGDDQVCYMSATETNCYTFEQNLDVPGEYRSRNVETGEVILFRISGTDPRIITRDKPPDDDGGLGAPSAQDIANELANPNTTLGTMNFQLDYIRYDGDLPDADDQEAFRLTFQPALPYPLSDRTNFFFRPAIPLIVDQDVPNKKGGFDSKGVDLDISFDAALGTTLQNGTFLLGGLDSTLPTATNDAFGLDQWLLGPEAAFLGRQRRHRVDRVRDERRHAAAQVLRPGGARGGATQPRALSDALTALKAAIDEIPKGPIKERFIGGISNQFNIMYVIGMKLRGPLL